MKVIRLDGYKSKYATKTWFCKIYKEATDKEICKETCEKTDECSQYNKNTN